MAEEIRHPDGRIEHPSVHTEKTDASFSWIAGILAGAAVLAVIIHGVILGFFYEYRGYEADIKKSPFPLAAKPSEELPPEPRLEPLDRLNKVESSNVYERQLSRETILKRYGTREEGFVHIPIKQAMTLLDGKLPARQGPAVDERRGDGLVDSGESNSGRMFRGKPRWFEP